MSDLPPIIEILSKHYKNWEFSIGYTDIRLSGLPEFIDVNASRLVRKDDFHITTINVKEIAELIDPKNNVNIMMKIVEVLKIF